ncbi:TetR/AcrR family transcriptional regulator [Nocardia sp. NBC_01329]|uniref:TetR/AcrR family transcriptional regulator n=1 Tax=Nocardia sp. NBC_01329 TaxID=2903594 RepID=UPI002E1442B6|nr:TetR/AcrR family transcriptional regulator [Nocardia sp. NBC_01329]
MPRVSDEHLERRRQQILDAARICFVRKGFHQTSMQDVFTESGLSAGAVYRYFKSKDELVIALASTAAGDIRAQMAAVIHSDPLPTPAELVGRMADWIIAQSGPEGRIRLAPQAWSLALVNEDAAIPVRQAMSGVREMWREYAERMRTAGWLPPDADLDAVASALFGLLPGFVLQHLLLGDPVRDRYLRGVETLFPYGAPATRPQSEPAAVTDPA